MSFAEKLEKEARLFILKTLAGQRDHRLNSTMLRDEMADLIGINRSRDWTNLQLLALEELGAVSLVRPGEIYIAEITKRGLDHLHNREGVVLPGVAPPEA